MAVAFLPAVFFTCHLYNLSVATERVRGVLESSPVQLHSCKNNILHNILVCSQALRGPFKSRASRAIVVVLAVRIVRDSRQHELRSYARRLSPAPCESAVTAAKTTALSALNSSGIPSRSFGQSVTIRIASSRSMVSLSCP